MKMKIGEGSELVGEEILQVTAFDENEPGSPNSVISYRLLNDSPEFRMDDGTGTIRLIRDVDRERQDLYELLVVAEDGGSPKLSTSSAAAASSRVVKVMEDWPVGGVVTQVIARDEDLGMAGRVRYSLLETGAGEEDFVLDEVSGVLRVKKQLDYETTSIYNLTVRAKDMGTPALSSDTFIVVELS
jgi:hypothetical protein